MASLDLLQSWKSSITDARMQSEKLVTTALPSLSASAAPVVERVKEVRGFIGGVMLGHTSAMKAVKALVEGENVPQLKARSEKTVAPADVWEARFKAALETLPAEMQTQSQRSLAVQLRKLAEHTRILVVWEGILDQLIAKASVQPAAAAPKPNGKPKPPAKEQDTSDLDDFAPKAAAPAVIAQPEEPIELDASQLDLTDWLENPAGSTEATQIGKNAEPKSA